MGHTVSPLKLPIAFLLLCEKLGQYFVPSIRLSHLSSSGKMTTTFSVLPSVQPLYMMKILVTLHILASYSSRVPETMDLQG